MRRPEDIIIRPILTEKAERLRDEYNKYTFEVRLDATKPEIKKAIEELFKVRVLKVNTMIVKPKKKRVLGRINRYGETRKWKKAIVTVHPEDKIEFEV